MSILSILTGKSNRVEKSHIKNLIELANADGHFDSRENDFLHILAKRDKVSQRLIRKISSETSNIELQVPEDETIKFKQFYDLVRMMLADEVIHEMEIKVLSNLGEKFGYPKQHLKELIESVVGNIRNGQNAESAMSRVARLLK